MVDTADRTTRESEEASRAIFTLANVVSFVRLLMVPLYLFLLMNGQNLAATLVFATAAATDFLDGQIARRTHTVSKLGQLLDPAVDRVLMVTGVLGVFLVGRIPLWVIVVVIVGCLSAHRRCLPPLSPSYPHTGCLSRQVRHHLSVHRVFGPAAELAACSGARLVRCIVAARFQRRAGLLGHLVHLRRARALPRRTTRSVRRVS